MKGFRYATNGNTLRLYKSDHRTDKKIVFLRRSTPSDLRGRGGSKIPRVESGITSTRGHRWDVGSLQEQEGDTCTVLPRCHNSWNVRLLSAFHVSLPTALSSLGTPNRTVAVDSERCIVNFKRNPSNHGVQPGLEGPDSRACRR